MKSDILGLTLICLSDKVFEIITFNNSSVGKSIPKNKKSYIANTIAKKIVNKLLINDKNIN